MSAGSRQLIQALYSVVWKKADPHVNQCNLVAGDEDSTFPAKRQRLSMADNTNEQLSHAIKSVQTKSSEQRPTVCFVCVGNPSIPLKERITKYATTGSLTRHYLRKHVNPPWSSYGVECHVCGKPLQNKKDLLSHAEDAHGTVVRGQVRGIKHMHNFLI